MRALVLGAIVFVMICFGTEIAPGQVNPPLAWDEIWSFAVREAHAGRLFTVASSRASDPQCADANTVLDAIPLLSGAFAAHRYGDALHALGAYEQKVLCLDLASSDLLNDLLGFHLYHALTIAGKPPLSQALFALGLLAFDQNPPLRQGIWLRVVRRERHPLANALTSYPNSAFGVWSYNANNGELARSMHGQNTLA